jgi:hypothetical protein
MDVNQREGGNVVVFALDMISSAAGGLLLLRELGEIRGAEGRGRKDTSTPYTKRGSDSCLRSIMYLSKARHSESMYARRSEPLQDFTVSLYTHSKCGHECHDDDGLHFFFEETTVTPAAAEGSDRSGVSQGAPRVAKKNPALAAGARSCCPGCSKGGRPKRGRNDSERAKAI